MVSIPKVAETDISNHRRVARAGVFVDFPARENGQGRRGSDLPKMRFISVAPRVILTFLVGTGRCGGWDAWAGDTAGVFPAPVPPVSTSPASSQSSMQCDFILLFPAGGWSSVTLLSGGHGVGRERG